MSEKMMTSRWADEIEDDEEYLPPPQSQEVQVKDGERLVTEIITDPETGKKKKNIRIFQLEKKLVSKGVIERKRWAKFGASGKDGLGPNLATTVVGDPVSMYFVGSKEPEIQDDFKDLKAEGKGFVRCRFCQENHFSAKCPYKEAGIPTDFLITTKDLSLDDRKDSADPKAFSAQRRDPGRRGETMMSSTNRKDEFTIRISNLPESMSEMDMQELCSPFGKTDRIFLAKDRGTGVCKGFAFVTYQTRETASRAINHLHGYGYDHLILNVEWSKPTTSN